jgi:hypothetical protein
MLHGGGGFVDDEGELEYWYSSVEIGGRAHLHRGGGRMRLLRLKFFPGIVLAWGAVGEKI